MIFLSWTPNKVVECMLSNAVFKCIYWFRKLCSVSASQRLIIVKVVDTLKFRYVLQIVLDLHLHVSNIL